MTVIDSERIQQKQKPQQRQAQNPKRLPPYVVILENDDLHSFDYVILVLQKVFGYSVEKAYQLTMEAHAQGRAAVWSGAKEHAELKCEQIKSAGPDPYAEKASFPLGAYIEPLPQ